MKINEIVIEQSLEEGPKARAAALAAMLGAAGAAGYNLSNKPTTIPATQPSTTITQVEPAAPDNSVIGKMGGALQGYEPNIRAEREPKPFVPSEHMDTLIRIAKQMGITNKDDLANFLAQCKVETADWRKATEQFTYQTAEVLRRAYTSRFPSVAVAELYLDSGEVAIANRALSNKNGNGDEASGDGWRYRGRGFIHITGRAIYARVGAGVHPNNPDIYIKNPALLSSNPVESAKAAAWYYANMVGKGRTASQASLKVNPAGLKKAERIAASDYYKAKLSPKKPPQKPTKNPTRR